MGYLLLIILLALLLKAAWQLVAPALHLFTRGFWRLPDIFNSNWVDLNAYYLYLFSEAPSVISVYQIDCTDAYRHLSSMYAGSIVKVLQSNWVNPEPKEVEFNECMVVMKGKLVVEFDGGCATIAYGPKGYAFARQLALEFDAFRKKEREKEYEMNVIRMTKNGLVLKPVQVKPTDLDLALYYNDDFMEVDDLIRKRLGQSGDKGIVLLHGLPGTGKTTYLRYLVGRISKRILFVSASVAENLMDPAFMDLLLDHPNSVLVIEDAESVMMDRKLNSGSSVSNLLNLSDGLVSDCISVQVVCTFNSSLNLIDPALLRKGRMIARYEFGKLTADKAQKLSDSLGFSKEINEPMTLAEVTGQQEKTFGKNKIEIIGFRRQEVVEN
ncbi:MAG: ATP-binding protein [Chitinophagaceae bacterium]|nr:MAG: ATP-binding protein [Chitinophagaceae bacterium]